MSFFKRQGITDTNVGRLYVIRMVLLDNMTIHKIGMTHSDRATDRMMEILRSWFVAYRYVPYTELRLDMKTEMPLVLEKHIHKELEEFRYIPDKKVDGGCEMFTGLDEEAVLHYLRFEVYEDLDTENLNSKQIKYVKSQIIEDIPY